MNAPHSKCGIGASLSGVRIPPSPPHFALTGFVWHATLETGFVAAGFGFTCQTALSVIPGCAERRRPGIHHAAVMLGEMDSRLALTRAPE